MSGAAADTADWPQRPDSAGEAEPILLGVRGAKAGGGDWVGRAVEEAMAQPDVVAAWLAADAEDGHDELVRRLERALRSSDAYRAERASRLIATLARQVFALAEVDRQAVTVGLDALLDALGHGMPPLNPWAHDSSTNLLREEAAFWAGCANEREVMAVLIACVDRLCGAAVFPQTLAVRALAEIWKSVPPDTRRAFLARVDPGGNLRGKP